MFESIIHMVTQGAAHSHTPQAAVMAILCAALLNFFS